jgi:diguanylate cyclase (GGDEF)-like protein
MVLFHDEWALLRSTASEVAASVMQASFEVEDARRRTRRFQELSERDPLTGLWNRRTWDRNAVVVTADAAAGEPVSLAVLDLDHFKQVNDQHSHVVGDRVLRVVAGMLTEEAGHDGRAVRFGGEEFLLILRAPGAVAVERCERVRRRVMGHDWDAVAPGLRVTISIGVAVVLATDTRESVLYRADRLLYAAKHRGRNLVVGEEPTRAVEPA